MNHFKKPLKITGITFLAGLIIGIGAVTWIHFSDIPARKHGEYASLLGSITAFGILMIVCPFWFFAAAKVGQDRRAAREKKRQNQS